MSDLIRIKIDYIPLRGLLINLAVCMEENTARQSRIKPKNTCMSRHLYWQNSEELVATIQNLTASVSICNTEHIMLNRFFAELKRTQNYITDLLHMHTCTHANMYMDPANYAHMSLIQGRLYKEIRTGRRKEINLY